MLADGMADSPLTPSEYALYSHVGEVGPCPPSQIARDLRVPATTVTVWVRAMLGKGHAERRPSREDGRSYDVALTEAGIAAHAAAREAFDKCGVVVKVGFNHRFHPALLKAREQVDAGELGPLMFLRGRYGHGGRLGMEKEWRGKPQIAGGGEMLDQGVHLVDLARWFLGEFPHVTGHVSTDFWDWPVEDNGFALLWTEKGQTAMLHASCRSICWSVTPCS